MKNLIILALLLFSFSVMGQNFHTDMEHNFHTEFRYFHSINKGITIKNSYPKGGERYVDPNGKVYVYVVFWTCIANETDSNLEITINFPIDSFPVYSAPDINFNFYLPKERMTIEKAGMLDYGLDLKSFLDKNIDKSSELLVTICPKDSYSFYVAALSNRGVNGVVRAGFELENKGLIYNINGYKINCGKITTK